MASYKVEFFDKLIENIKTLQDQLTVDEKHNLTKSVKNTCLFARALHDTFGQVGDVAGIMVMTFGCDFSPIDIDPNKPVKVERVAETGEVKVSQLES